MAVIEPTPLNPEEIAELERLQAEAGNPPADAPKKRGRKPGSTNKKATAAAPLTKASLHQMLEMASGALFLSERTRVYALEPGEIEALTDSWYEVIRLYPSVGGYFAMGNKLTAWGQALMITTVILDRKVKNGQAVQAELAAGAARSDSGAQRNGQDYATAAAPGDAQVFNHGGF